MLSLLYCYHKPPFGVEVKAQIPIDGNCPRRGLLYLYPLTANDLCVMINGDHRQRSDTAFQWMGFSGFSL